MPRPAAARIRQGGPGFQRMRRRHRRLLHDAGADPSSDGDAWEHRFLDGRRRHGLGFTQGISSVRDGLAGALNWITARCASSPNSWAAASAPNSARASRASWQPTVTRGKGAGSATGNLNMATTYCWPPRCAESTRQWALGRTPSSRARARADREPSSRDATGEPARAAHAGRGSGRRRSTVIRWRAPTTAVRRRRSDRRSEHRKVGIGWDPRKQLSRSSESDRIPPALAPNRGAPVTSLRPTTARGDSSRACSTPRPSRLRRTARAGRLALLAGQVEAGLDPRPLAGRGWTASVPSGSSARSRMPGSPNPVVLIAGSNPRPSSRTVTWIACSCSRISTTARRASPCLVAFVSAS